MYDVHSKGQPVGALLQAPDNHWLPKLAQIRQVRLGDPCHVTRDVSMRWKICSAGVGWLEPVP